MGIFMGYISLLCFILLAGKYVVRKMKNHRVDRFFQILHKPVSCIFLSACAIHLAFVLPVLKERSRLVTVSGGIVFGIAILLILLCHLIKNGECKMFWHRVLTVVLLAGIIFHVIVYVIDFMQYKNKIAETEVADINIENIPNGKYIGEYDVGYIYAKVQVIIKDGKISEIEILEHRNERGQGAEQIPEKIIEQQRIDVDTVTGATNSGLVIEKACENALSGETVILK